MKLTKIISSGRALWESIRRPQCNNGRNKQDTSRKIQNGKNKLSKLKTEPISQSNNFLKHEAIGAKKKSLAVNQVKILKDNVINQKTKHTNDINKKECKNNIGYNNKTKLSRISSSIFFRRTFSKYNDVEHKLKAKFKSSYKNCGQFDPSWTKYKAYVNKNQNKKNKSYLKNSICNPGAREGLKNKNSTAPCADLPGKGTYNHRIAYDEALQLYRKGIEVDVLYKVKNNKTDSIYVVNGGFLHAKNKRFSSQSKKHHVGSNINNINQNQIDDNNTDVKDEKQSSAEEETLWLAELAKIQKDKEIRKNRLANITLVRRKHIEKEKKEKLEKFLRNQKIKEIEKKFRVEQLRKIARTKALKEIKQKQEARNKKEKLRDGTNQLSTDLQEKMDHKTEMKRLRRLKVQKNLLAYRNGKNTIDNPLDTKHTNALGEHEVYCNVHLRTILHITNCYTNGFNLYESNKP